MKKLSYLLLPLLMCFSVEAQTGLHFDDADDVIQTTYPGILGNNPITVEAWIKPNATSGESIITDWGSDAVNGGRFTFRVKQLTSSDVLRVEIKGGGLDGTFNIADGNWHHVALVYNPSLSSNRYKIYVDGNLDVEGDISQTLNVIANVNLRMGRRISTSFTGWYGGYMDEVRVWNVARSQADIQANMNAEFCSTQAGLMAYFKFNEGVADGNNTSISTVMDAANGYDGTLIDFAKTGTTSNWVAGSGVAVAQGFSQTNTYTECQGFSVTVGSNTYSSTGVYTDVFAGSNGCDSTIITDLTIIPASINALSYELCNGDSVQVNNLWYTQSGQYNDTLVGAASTGCDSVLQINVQINAPIEVNEIITLCAGESYVLNGTTYATTGTYTEVFVGGSVLGCDSTVNLDLTVLDEVVDSVTYVECAGFSVQIDTLTFDTTGIYTVVLTNASASGCDSTIVLDLYVEESINTTLTVNNGIISSNQTTGTYQWIDCSNGTELVGETSQSFEPTMNGEYAVVITIGSCSDTSECYLMENVGVEMNELERFTVYPNPVNAELKVELSHGTQGQLVIYDLSGRQMATETLVGKTSVVDVRNYNAGTYLVQVTTEMGTQNVFITKQ